MAFIPEVTSAATRSQHMSTRGNTVAGVLHAASVLTLCTLGLGASAAMAAPCDSMMLPLRSADRSALDNQIAKQLNVQGVSVKQSYGNSDWSVFYVTTSDNDQTFVVYEGDPITTRYQALWGGSPTDYTNDQILDWTRTNVTGIPEPLAECLSWAMRQDRQT